jgi:hypothetical protein
MEITIDNVLDAIYEEPPQVVCHSSIFDSDVSTASSY